MRRSILCVLFFGGLLASTTILAQDAEKPEESPRYHNLRYEEDWSSSLSASQDLWQSVKHIPITEAANVYASLGGQIRFRPEFWSNFQSSGPEDDTFGLIRTRVHGDVHIGPHFRIFLEGKSALASGRELPGGTRIIDADSAALQNAFLDFRFSLKENRTLTFRVGRQEMQYGRQRLVSPLDWANTRPRMFDGFRGIARLGSWQIDAFWSRFVRVRKYTFNNHDSGLDFFGFYASGNVLDLPLTLDLYWLGLDRDETVSRTTEGERRHTLGTRISGTFARRRWDFDLESAFQFGRRERRDIGALMLASQVGHTLSSASGTPRVYLGFDYASGDSDPSDDKLETFDQLFPLGHAYFGYIDFVGRQNIVDFSQGISVRPIEKLTISTEGHFFWRAQKRDALYDAGGNIVRAGSLASAKKIGSEVDLTGRIQVDRHTVITLGWSHFFPGSFIRETGAAESINFTYLMFEYTF